VKSEVYVKRERVEGKRWKGYGSGWKVEDGGARN